MMCDNSPEAKYLNTSSGYQELEIMQYPIMPVKKKRKRAVKSVKEELLKKAREAALSAVQIFNNPVINFKAETFTILMIIAWTYLLHAYYKQQKVDYRHKHKDGGRVRLEKIRCGVKYWSLFDCLESKDSPIDSNTCNNLKFLIGLRDEIEHRMTTRIDDALHTYFQACCLNFNDYIKSLFGGKYGIEKYLMVSLQFSGISRDQKEILDQYPDLPDNILSYIRGFESQLTAAEKEDPRFEYRVFFDQKIANRPGQADKVVAFLKKEDSANDNAEIVYIKETDKNKYLPKQIVEMMRREGFTRFKMKDFVDLWKSQDAKKNGKGYGILVAGKQWFWYESWVKVVREHCKTNSEKYR